MSVDNLVGQTLGAYELHSLLGSGGMGAVYRAVQTTLRREVALKVLPSELARQPGYIDRFTREAKVAAALEHPHTVPIYDYGTQRDISYVVMRLLTGGSLSDRIQQAQENSRLPSLGEISDLLRQLVSALEYAHSRGVIHRDIKPSNVMFDAHGNAYLVDFGIAKLLGATNALTGTGQALGTPSYMPPEQWRDDPITPAADQYALAVLVYSLLTGRLPFEATTLYALMHKHLTEAPPAPQTYRADVPPALTDVLDRALAKTPEERFSTVTEFSRAFDAAAETNRGSQTGFFYVQPQTPIVEGQTPPPLPPTPPAQSAAVAPQPPGNTASTLLPPVEPRRGRSPLVWIVALVALAVVVVGVYLALPRPPEADSGPTRTAVALAALNAGPTDTPTDLSGQAGATQTAVAAANDATGMPAPADTGEPTAAETEPPTPVSSATSEATAQVVVLAATNTDVPPTETITPTPTDTEPPSATPTLTHTPTATPSHTPAATPTATPTPTDMPTDEPTATATPTPTATPTDEPTLTATPTNTPTDLPTATATLPPTDLPTATEPPAPLAAISLQFDTPSSGNGWGSPVLSEDTGQTITWMVSPLATLSLWLEQGADYNLKFRLTGATAPEVLDSLTLAVNGVAVPLTYRDDREGARVYDATIPADAIGAGPSVLAFKAREAGAAQAGDDSGPRIAAFDWLRVEARALPDVAVTPTAVPTANAAVAQIEIGQRVEGSVSPGADERWAFAGHTDEHILVTLTSPGMEMALELLDPSGATIAADQTSTDATNVFVQALLPVDGTYTLVVRAADGAQAGAYRLRLLEAPPRSSLYVEPATLVGQLAERGVIAAVGGELAEEPGAYIIDLTSQDDTLSRVHLNGQYTDFVMGGTLTFGPGAPDDACGFVFYEINDQNYYLIEIDQQGLLSFVEQQRGEWQPAQQVELTDVKLGAGASNQVVLVAVDNRFQVSVNDTPFTQFEDNSLAGGLVSIEATTFADSDETYCVFTDVWLWNLGG